MSHETIYSSLYLRGVSGLKRELVAALRSGRLHRRPDNKGKGGGKGGDGQGD